MGFQMLLLSVLVALAAQEPTPASPPENALVPARVVAKTEIGRLKDPVQQAKSACPWIGAKGSIACSPDALAHFNVVQDSTIEAPAGLEVRAVLVRSETCSQAHALSITLRHPDKPITIDWQRTTVDVDGVARRALPGFARSATAALAQRPSTAAAGSLLTEEVFVDGAKDCITTLPPSAQATTVRVALALKIGVDDDSAVIAQTLRWEAFSEHQAIMLLPVPPALPPPDEPFPASATAAAVGAGVGVAAGVGLGVVLAQQQPGNLGSAIGAGALCALFYAGCCGGAAYAAFWWPGGEEARRKGYFDALDDIAHRETLLKRQAEVAAQTP